jgi:hypothetical protein
MTKQKKPEFWERLEEESDKQFHAFQFYRDKGAVRSLRATAQYLDELWIVESHARTQRIQKHTGKLPSPDLTPEDISKALSESKEPKNYKSVKRWAEEFGWDERVRAYEGHLDSVRVKTTETEMADMVKRHVSLAGMIQNKALRRLREMQDAELTPKVVLDYLKYGIGLEQAIRGEPARERQQEVEANLTPEEKDLNVSGAKVLLAGRIKSIAAQKARSEESMAAFAEDDGDDAGEAPEHG